MDIDCAEVAKWGNTDETWDLFVERANAGSISRIRRRRLWVWVWVCNLGIGGVTERGKRGILEKSGLLIESPHLQ